MVPLSEQNVLRLLFKSGDSPIGRRPNVGVGPVDIRVERSRRGTPEGEGRPALPPPALLDNPALSLLQLGYVHL